MRVSRPRIVPRSFPARFDRIDSSNVLAKVRDVPKKYSRVSSPDTLSTTCKNPRNFAPGAGPVPMLARVLKSTRHDERASYLVSRSCVSHLSLSPSFPRGARRTTFIESKRLLMNDKKWVIDFAWGSLSLRVSLFLASCIPRGPLNTSLSTPPFISRERRGRVLRAGRPLCRGAGRSEIPGTARW